MGRQPPDLLVPGVPSAEADRPQGRRPHRAREHARELRRGARPRRAHDRVRRAARGPRRPRARRAAARARLLARPLAPRRRSRRASPTSPARRSAAIELDVDLKLPGYEARVVDALRAHGLVERTLVSTQYMRSLVKLRELEPALRLGWSVPRVKRDYTRSLLYAVPAYTFLLYARRRLPGVAAGHIAAGRCDAVMCHFKLVTPGAARGRPRRGRRALRLDGRRRAPDPLARGARRHGRDHQRPAAVRRGRRSGDRAAGGRVALRVRAGRGAVARAR